MVVAPTTLPAMIAAMPTAPAPNTARLWPAPTFRALITDPAPVGRPQPSGPSNSSGASFGTLMALRSLAKA